MPGIDVGELAINSQKEATIRLEVTDARRKVTHAEHHLALCMAQEHDILGQLYRFQAERVEKAVTAAEHGIGDLRDSI